MKKLHRLMIATIVSASVSACTATGQNTVTAPAVTPAPEVLVPQSSSVATTNADPAINPSTITLEKIMSDPDWLGRQPSRPQWSLDGSRIEFLRKREGSSLNDYYAMPHATADNGNRVALQQMHLVNRQQQVKSNDGRYIAWVFESNMFVFDQQTNQSIQLTKDSDNPRDLMFLTDNRVAYRVGNKIFALQPQTGARQQLAEWRFAEKPVAVKPAKDFIAREQIELIDYVALQREQRQQRSDASDALHQANATTTQKPFYLSKKHENVAVALSPNGETLIVVTREDKPTRSDTDIMPNYIQEDGRIAVENVRRRVADATPESHTVWLLDLTAHTQKALSFVNLPGYNDDVLADVKRENAAARGEDYQVNRLPRDIGLLQSWYGIPSVQWHQNGQQVALMLEAWDNKDRWIVSVDFDNKQLVTQHRLSDEAWVNYAFNQFGWLHNSETLFYLSEQSGYSHLYVKPINGDAKALTQGRFEVDDITFSADDRFAFFKANVKHPGIYEVYRVNIETGEQKALTDLNGMTDYELSPDERHLLLTHSTLTMPPELYSLEIGSDAEPQRETFTVSDAFLAMPWVAPSIVPVPSSHQEAPIYSRVYLPTTESTEKRRAVIFNHGAGYLQNSHAGWSGYFREFMFHSMLVQQGYVVMDMDYRASKGYGRDWRTAIYRQMGTPETQDLVDGVVWLVSNANVDGQRIGTYGGSYGGFMTFMALFTEPELFQAGAALRPVSDWAHYNHPYTSNILNTPDVDPIAYRRSSPIYFADGLQKPLLINAPMIDDNVFFVDVVRLVQRLIELEKEDFETAIYPVEPHGFVQPSSWLDEYRRIYKLFEQNL